jgi:hypothetical protein
MGLSYKEVQTTGTECVAAIKQAILSSSDWSHLQLTTGTQATTLASSASVGATSISTVATIPTGSYVVIGNGLANPEVRITTGVSGSGPYTVTFAKALESAWSSGDAVGVGGFVKATTARGADMILDLADAAVTTGQIQIGLYRTHNGTTSTDKVVRYLGTKVAALTNTMRARVSVSKEHLYVDLEGPRWGETGYDTSYGPYKSYIFIGDLTPYHASDLVPAVVAIMGDINGGTTGTGSRAVVSRNQADDTSWVFAQILTLTHHTHHSFDSDGAYPNMAQHYSKGDGKLYVWPYVVVEDRDGIRGRISRIHNAGWSASNGAVQAQYSGAMHSGIVDGTEISYGGITYRAMKPIQASANASGGLALSQVYAYRNNDYSPLVAVPISEP